MATTPTKQKTDDDEGKASAIERAQANSKGLGGEGPPAANPPSPKPAPRPPGKAQGSAISPAHPALQRKPVHKTAHLSDDDILRMYEKEDADQFFIDLDIVPAGVVYEFKRHEVVGQDDKPYEAELQRRGWVPVMAEWHDGYFMPKGTKGQVVRGGQGLYMMDEWEYKNRKRFDQLKAREAVLDNERNLGMAPKDTFERVAPRIKTNYEAVDVE